MGKLTFFLVLLPVLGLAYHDKCIPECSPTGIHPNKGGPNCRCTPEANLPGCQIYACKPGENSQTEFTCMCTPEIHPRSCVSLRCNNSTFSVSTEDGSETAGVDSTACNKLCNCRQQPPDCTATSEDQIDGAPDCTCTPDYWTTGCTLRPCRKGDTHDQLYVCECTKEYSPDFCYKPMCTGLLG